MGYLCVNKDGQELICQNEPCRWGTLTKPLRDITGEIRINKKTGEVITQEVPARSWELG